MRMTVHGLQRWIATLVLLSFVFTPVEARAPLTASTAQRAAAARDGQRDFDFEIGTWRTQLRRLVKPLTGSTTWAEYEGTTVVRQVARGPANLLEFDVQGPAGRIEALSLRLYNPQTREWSVYYSNRATGTLEPPIVGRFANGRGEFFGKDTLDGRPILVRFVISDITPRSCHFEQAFSSDGGKTWEVNWVVTDTRVTAK
jgi:hypothetical protein